MLTRDTNNRVDKTVRVVKAVKAVKAVMAVMAVMLALYLSTITPQKQAHLDLPAAIPTSSTDIGRGADKNLVIDLGHARLDQCEKGGCVTGKARRELLGNMRKAKERGYPLGKNQTNS